MTPSSSAEQLPDERIVADAREAPARSPLLALSYVLPIRSEACDVDTEEMLDLTAYLRRLAGWVDEVLVVDGSPPEVFAQHERLWSPTVRLVVPDASLVQPPDKAAGVVTGSRLAHHDLIVVADDDVRWTRDGLVDALARLQGSDLVRPQNRFVPAPWHARWDTARMLLNRASGGDWPGTTAVRRRFVAPGYAYGVLFENLDLVRTVRARGGCTTVARDLVVDRRPPDATWFWRQRVRQAYDEWARPWHLVWQLALLPAVLVGGRRAALALAGAGVAVAEIGRRRGGRRAFPPSAALWAPAWLAERAVCSWLAVGARLRGGVRYRGGRVLTAATPLRDIRSHSRHP